MGPFLRPRRAGDGAAAPSVALRPLPIGDEDRALTETAKFGVTREHEPMVALQYDRAAIKRHHFSDCVGAGGRDQEVIDPPEVRGPTLEGLEALRCRPCQRTAESFDRSFARCVQAGGEPPRSRQLNRQVHASNLPAPPRYNQGVRPPKFRASRPRIRVRTLATDARRRKSHETVTEL